MINKEHSNKSIITLNTKKRTIRDYDCSSVDGSNIEDKENIQINQNVVKSKGLYDSTININSVSSISYRSNDKLGIRSDLKSSNLVPSSNASSLIVKEQKIPLTITKMLSNIQKDSKVEVSLIEKTNSSKFSDAYNEYIKFNKEKNGSLNLIAKQNLRYNNNFLETIKEGKLKSIKFYYI